MAASELSPEEIVAAVRQAWPGDQSTATAILHCESRSGADPRTWALSRPDGGPLQINRSTWADYFWEKYGWSWEQIVLDLETHLSAAREIYELTGGWEEWSCSDYILTSSE